ncbi:MopE-related protein [Pyxidicoccus trucidator]|uniref:MopE-related protein n=1 Tax=Pyxidicoccus trucidator TaxID=2709662 RepID=UPI0013DD2A8E|nr:MopE-related protein [Pyxidicoccus trucidator]
MKRQCLEVPRSRLTWCTAVLLLASLGCGGPEPVPGSEEAPATTRQGLAAVRVPQTVAAGAYHSLFLRKDGEVWAWGQNTAGQLGTGNTSTTPLPQPSRVNGLPPIKALAAGVAHSLALDVDGNVWVWGQNASGQVGLGIAGGTVLVPTKVTLPGIQAIAANGSFSLALGTDGRLWAWGQNTSGQIGTGATSPSVATPVVVAGLPTIRSMAAGLNHALALDADGKVWGWGQNTAGQVGTGATSTNVLVPTQAAGLPRATAIAAGGSHSLVIDEQFGNVWAWGQNTFGQVGTGSTSTTPVLAPTAVTGLFAVKAISAGHFFSLAIMGDGFVKAWGHNVSGQLGNGGTVNSAVPVSVTGVADAKALAAGAQHAVALRPGCPVWAWGNNGQGQLGTGSTSTVATTAPVSALITNTFYFDGDMDGFGDEYVVEYACEPSPGFVEEIDCDDYMPTTYPGAPEECNGVDDSCDEAVDEGNPRGGETCATGKPGVCGAGTTACVAGNVACEQVQAASAEQCDSLDNDCDGESDEGNPGGLQACSTGLQGVCGEGVTYCTHGAIDCVQKEDASAELCDSKDNDCNGQPDDGLSFVAWYRDQDGDDYGLTDQAVQACAKPSGHAPNPGDCNDTNAVFNPGAIEVCDGMDNDCDTQADEGLPTQAWYRDADGDGTGNAGETVQNCRQPAGFVADATDCNDASAAIKPGGTEVCDALDNDCDAQVDEGLMGAWYRDADGDGFGDAAQETQACAKPTGYVASSSDCNDSNAAIKPGATEVCDSVDNNCSGAVDEGVAILTWYRDADGDTYGTSTNTLQTCSQPSGYVAAAGDCNDASASIKPGATEVCDSADNNCNGSTDEGVGSTFYRDADGDGHGNAGLPTQACSQPSGYVSNTTDCNDSSASIKPGATEVCDSADNNCNGTVDEGVGSTWYRDADGDGYGNASQSSNACSQPSGYVSNVGDCNDSSASIKPGATEVCDGVDNNCSGTADEGVGSTFYRDADSDGYGTASQSTQACSQPAGYVSSSSDCNDSNAGIRPGASETCDGADNNCNGTVDEGVKSTWFRDADSDGYGNLNQSTQACSKPSGYVSNAGDCNDSSGSISPSAWEVCDGSDNDCNGSVDDGVGSTWYRDVDGDGYGNSNNTREACSRPSGYVSNDGDCNDSSSSTRPGATELCDSIDNNCNGMGDEPAKQTYYRDADGDSYGTSSVSTQQCSQPSGYVSNTSDCNDSNAGIRPGATEVCDSADNNCNGSVDEGVGSTWYQDKDGDGYGSPQWLLACSRPSGFVSNASDCDDSNGGLHPGATEVCDGIDNNCSGAADEGSVCSCSPGETRCNGTCINTTDDFNNCGGCGVRCPNYKFECIDSVCEYM